MQRRGTVSATRLFDVGTVLNECFHGGWASKAHGMMKRRNAIFVGCVNVRTSDQQLSQSPPLICLARIALATNIEQFVLHRM